MTDLYMNSPLYIETQYSWFELRAPAHSYQRIHQRFYLPHRIAQIIVSTAIKSPAMPLDEFAEANYGEWDAMLGEYIHPEDIQEAVCLSSGQHLSFSLYSARCPSFGLSSTGMNRT